MLNKKIFIGTNRDFRDNLKALSLHAMDNPFIISNQYDYSKVGYSIRTSSSILSDQTKAIESIFENIDLSEIAILDVTPDDNEIVSHFNDFILKLFGRCLKGNKKVILIFNETSNIEYIKILIKSLKEKNLLGLISHDGKTLPKTVMEIVDLYYSKDSRYDKNTKITIDNPNYDIKETVNNWIKEKELTFDAITFINIHITSDLIRISYEGYNTPSLRTLQFDIYNLNDIAKEYIEQQIRRIFPESNNVHVYNHTGSLRK